MTLEELKAAALTSNDESVNQMISDLKEEINTIEVYLEKMEFLKEVQKQLHDKGIPVGIFTTRWPEEESEGLTIGCGFTLPEKYCEFDLSKEQLADIESMKFEGESYFLQVSGDTIDILE